MPKQDRTQALNPMPWLLTGGFTIESIAYCADQAGAQARFRWIAHGLQVRPTAHPKQPDAEDAKIPQRTQKKPKTVFWLFPFASFANPLRPSRRYSDSHRWTQSTHPAYSQGTSRIRSPSRRMDASRPRRTSPVEWKMRPLRIERACTRAQRCQRASA